MPDVKPVSKRDRIRDEAERVLREHSGPLHVSALASLVAERLGFVEADKNVNTALHDDRHNRFLRVGRGTWVLAAKAR